MGAIMNVGLLRELIKDLPDTALILPDWFEEPPDDTEVELNGFEVRVSDGKTYLAALVSVISPEQDESCYQCGNPFTTDDNGIANHRTNDWTIDYDQDADHVPYGEPPEL